jgi:hypothetical protein
MPFRTLRAKAHEKIHATFWDELGLKKEERRRLKSLLT